MHTLNLRPLLRRLLLVSLMVACNAAAAQTPVTVVEYYVRTLDSYFISSRPGEIANLDALPATFTRTGVQFEAFALGSAPAGADDVCRYYISKTSPAVSSHFYGLNRTDCPIIASINPAGFSYDGLDFSVLPASNGVCPAAAPKAVYRLLRAESSKRNPNHRYSADRGTYDQFIKQGWSGEGVAFCVTSATNATFKAGTDFATCAMTPPDVASRGLQLPSALSASNCSLTGQKSWVRRMADESYLWASQSAKPDPAAFASVDSYYDAVLFKPTDRYSWVQDAAPTYDSFSGAATPNLGLGALAYLTSNSLVVRHIEKNTPADAAGLGRGTVITAINGENVGPPTLSAAQLAALFPSTAGTVTTLTLRRRGNASTETVVLVAQNGVTQTVDHARVIVRPNGDKVGYLAFHSFLSQSNAELATTLKSFKSAGIVDLVLDVRYNGGGLVSVANNLASMIGGNRVLGQVFSTTRFTERQPGTNDSEYFDVDGTDVGARHGLPRVFVLATGRSASASELVINALRPFMDVVVVGSTTYGKPVGSYLHPFSREGNCGKLFAMISFETVNACGGGGYYSGITVNCQAGDDLSRDFGDADETMLATALRYRDAGACPAGFAASGSKQTADLPVREVLSPRERFGLVRATKGSPVTIPASIETP